MKRKVAVVLIVLIVLCAVLFAGLKIYIAHEERVRAAAPGNADRYNVENLSAHADSVLTGKRILFLGSSVTYGAAAQGQSFVELFEKLDGVDAIKEAKSGTTLVDKNSILALIAFGNGNSYVHRLKAIDPAIQLDCVVVQLSTNDATMKLPLGEISESKELTSFNTRTVTGAMEYVIRYCQDTWHCPVVFYTGSRYDSAPYQAMVERLHELQDKWGIGVIDLYTDEVFNDITPEQYSLYMFDPIHPTKAGYVEWWMPKMEEELIRILSE